MKFVYADESGDPEQGNVFVMCGVLVDAYKLRKKTADAERLFASVFARHSGSPTEIKTKAFLKGNGGWKIIPGMERREIVERIVDFAVDGGSKIVGIALAFDQFEDATQNGFGHPFGKSHWAAAGMFTCSLVQKRMQKQKNNKGLTIFVLDENKQQMPKVIHGVHAPDPWFDPLFQEKGSRPRDPAWLPRTDEDRFDQILNTPFPIDSKHACLVQVSDVVAYVYRRHLELAFDGHEEAYDGEAEFFKRCARKLDGARLTLGQTPKAPVVDFYKAAAHPGWKL